MANIRSWTDCNVIIMLWRSTNERSLAPRTAFRLSTQVWLLMHHRSIPTHACFWLRSTCQAQPSAEVKEVAPTSRQWARDSMCIVISSAVTMATLSLVFWRGSCTAPN